MTTATLSHAATRTDRIVAASIFIVCAVVIGLASTLRASPGGVGTHEQLGLAPCSFLSSTGIPCATCGMTTAFTLAAHGRIDLAFVVQPAGAALAVMSAAMMLISGYAAVSGMPLTPMFAAVCTTRNALWFGGFILLAWAYKTMVMKGMLW